MQEEQLQNITLIELIIKKTHLRWYTATGILALLLLSGLIISAFTEKTSFLQLGWNFWRVGLQGPIIIIYIFSIFPILRRIGNNAINSIVPLVNEGREELDKLASKYNSNSRLGELMSISIGILFILLLSQPWSGKFDFTALFLFSTQIILFGLLALLIYYGFHNSRYLIQINKKLDLDIFNLDSLAPIARWSLSISLAFIGGIVISIGFQTIDNLVQWQIIMTYSILVISTVAMFFISLWSTHVAIANVKRRELAFVQNKLSQACRKMTQQSEKDRSESERALQYEVAAWGIYERRIREAKEWPYNAAIIGRLVLSIVSPGVVYVLKLLTGNLPGL
jgi:MFS family permease